MPNQDSQFLNDASQRFLGPDNDSLPIISTELDSVRAYGWEVEILTPDLPDNSRALTLAAKQISGFGFNFADIEVHRMNDKVFYPGKISQDELTITFDNLLKGGATVNGQVTTATTALSLLSRVWSMETGEGLSDINTAKRPITIKEFDIYGNIRQVYEVIGAYPKSWTKGEKNYATSEFDTVEVKFRWDFLRVIT